jgi:hypothetical protein
MIYGICCGVLLLLLLDGVVRGCSMHDHEKQRMLLKSGQEANTLLDGVVRGCSMHDHEKQMMLLKSGQEANTFLQI